MLRSSVRAVMTVGFIAVCLCTSSLAAVKPSENLLPSTTKGFLVVENVDQLKESWNKTQLGQLMNDPSMKPFTEDMGNQIKKSWNKAQKRLGIALEDLEGVPSGEACLAIIQPSGAGTGAVALLIDVTGHLEQANVALTKQAGNMKVEKAQKVAGPKPEFTVYNLPLEDGEKKPRQTVSFLKDNLLAISDNLAVLEDVYARLDKSDDGLAELPAFKYVMARCKTGSQDLGPQARWFIEPFGYIDATRALNPPREKRRGTDPVKVFKAQGFTCIQGLGGYINFAADLPKGKYELLHRTAIYAPAVKKDSPEKYELAARMLQFPNGGDFTPQYFVPREIATYTAANWNVNPGFEYSKSLIDGLAGQEVIEDVIKGLKEDPLGPQIDIEKDIIGNLGSRITVLSDYQLPIGPKSERLVVAVDAKNEATVAATIAKDMESDPTARKLEFEGHVIWEIVADNEPPAAAPVVTMPGAKPAPVAEPEKGQLPNSAVSVAFGHMFVASHVDFLKKVIHQGAKGAADSADGLAQAIDFRLVMDEMRKVGVTETSVRVFSRTDEEYRVTYELIRNGQMPESESMLGQILNKLLGEGKEGVVRKQRIDGKNLPDFEAVRRYLGPAGAFLTSEDEGWYLVGFTLNKEMLAPPAVADVPAETAPKQ